MNAHEVIECYVTDVALKLPRRQRNDVAFELRALLHEELQDRADTAGRDADAAMATEFLNAFGRPADVAARYRPALAIIDPADGHVFLRATVIGLVVIWVLGLVEHLWRPFESGGDVLVALGQWWVGVVVPSPWWPGVLVLGFGIAAWTRRRWPQTAAWKPLAPDRIHGSRTALVLGIVGILCGLFVLLEPRWILDVIWSGRAAPAAYEALTYTETFRQRQGPWLFGLLVLNVPMFALVLVLGRWPATLRQLQAVQVLLLCAAMLWTVFDGPIFMAAASNGTAKFLILLITVISLIDFAIKLFRRVRPMPN